MNAKRLRYDGRLLNCVIVAVTRSLGRGGAGRVGHKADCPSQPITAQRQPMSRETPKLSGQSRSLADCVARAGGWSLGAMTLQGAELQRGDLSGDRNALRQAGATSGHIHGGDRLFGSNEGSEDCAHTDPSVNWMA
jgi:hypothetical protein